MRRSSTHEKEIWDVAVVGGGPAGMIAAGRAAEKGARVVLIEKNASLGKKLLITGGGRCNLSNAEFDDRKLLSKFKDSGKFLFSPFAQFGVQEALDFFHARNMPTKIEAEQRIFPLSNTARSVWETLVAYIQHHGVTVISNAPVTGLHAVDGRVESALIRGGRTLRARSFILATGGTSHPETGSTGDGYAWLRALGHSVSEASASLVPIALVAPAKAVAGVSLRDAKVTLFQYEVKQAQKKGKVLFTHVGLSGPCILNMSRDIGELLKYGPVDIEIDLISEMGYEKVNEALQAVFREHRNKKIRNSLKGIIAPALVPYVLERAGIDGDTFCNSVTRPERLKLIQVLKHLRFEVKGLLGMDKAVITAGGVALTEVDFKTMQSLKYPNLYLVGDILDIDRPSGGYSLQLCWTTGWVGGSSAAAR